MRQLLRSPRTNAVDFGPFRVHHQFPWSSVGEQLAQHTPGTLQGTWSFRLIRAMQLRRILESVDLRIRPVCYSARTPSERETISQASRGDTAVQACTRLNATKFIIILYSVTFCGITILLRSDNLIINIIDQLLLTQTPILQSHCIVYP